MEGETRLKQQQNLYEAVRADRNLYSKNLIQAQDEIQEMKRKFQIMVSIQSCIACASQLTSRAFGMLLSLCYSPSQAAHWRGVICVLFIS